MEQRKEEEEEEKCRHGNIFSLFVVSWARKKRTKNTFYYSMINYVFFTLGRCQMLLTSCMVYKVGPAQLMPTIEEEEASLKSSERMCTVINHTGKNKNGFWKKYVVPSANKRSHKSWSSILSKLGSTQMSQKEQTEKLFSESSSTSFSVDWIFDGILWNLSVSFQHPFLFFPLSRFLFFSFLLYSFFFSVLFCFRGFPSFSVSFPRRGLDLREKRRKKRAQVPRNKREEINTKKKKNEKIYYEIN